MRDPAPLSVVYRRSGSGDSPRAVDGLPVAFEAILVATSLETGIIPSRDFDPRTAPSDGAATSDCRSTAFASHRGAGTLTFTLRFT